MEKSSDDSGKRAEGLPDRSEAPSGVDLTVKSLRL